jgi:hypothetical protein
MAVDVVVYRLLKSLLKLILGFIFLSVLYLASGQELALDRLP